MFNSAGLGVGVIWLCKTWWTHSADKQINNFTIHHAESEKKRKTEKIWKKRERNQKITAKGRASHASRTESIKSKYWLVINTYYCNIWEKHMSSSRPLYPSLTVKHTAKSEERGLSRLQRECVGQHHIYGPEKGRAEWGGLQWLKPWTPCSNLISISIKAWTWVFWCSCTVKHYQHWHLESWMQHYKPSRVFIYWFICRNLTHIVTYPFLVCNLQQIYRLEEYSKSSFWKQYAYMHQFSSIWMNWIRLHICLHVLLTL